MFGNLSIPSIVKASFTPSPLGDGSTPGPLGKEKYTCTHSIVTQVVGGQTVYSLKCTNDYSEPSGGGGLLAAPTY